MMMEVDDQPLAFLFGEKRAFGRKPSQVHRTIFNKVVAGPWDLFEQYPLEGVPAGLIYSQGDKGIKNEAIAQLLKLFQEPDSRLVLAEVLPPVPGKDLYDAIRFHFGKVNEDGFSWHETDDICSVNVATSGKNATVRSFLYLPDKMLGGAQC
jgi:hypothetical protein